MPEKPGQRNIIGRRIREARMRQDVTQEELAARLAAKGVYFDRSAISRMEAEDRFIRDYEILAIADSLKIPVEWFFGRKPSGRR